MPVIPRNELTPAKILNHVERVHAENYGDRGVGLISRVFGDIVDLFNGRRPGYHRCDAEYHNLYHTMQTVPPFVEIINGWNKSGAIPRVSVDFFDYGTIAVLLHDTGYIKEMGDDDGTGAKYTLTHVQRSIDFAKVYLREIHLPVDGVRHILNIIRYTWVTLDIATHFRNDEERIVGCALGTADLLGQMSSPDYIDTLPILFNEFAESYSFEGVEKLHGKGSTLYANVDELIRTTPTFYEEVALKRFKMMGSMEKYIPYHYGGEENPYMTAIERNIRTIKEKWNA